MLNLFSCPPVEENQNFKDSYRLLNSTVHARVTITTEIKRGSKTTAPFCSLLTVILEGHSMMRGYDTFIQLEWPYLDLNTNLTFLKGNQEFCSAAAIYPKTLLLMRTWPGCPAMTSKWWHDSTVSLECWECKKYLTCYVIMTWSSQWKKVNSLHICKFFSSIHICFTWSH